MFLTCEGKELEGNQIEVENILEEETQDIFHAFIGLEQRDELVKSRENRAKRFHHIENGVERLDEIARDLKQQLYWTPNQPKNVGFHLNEHLNDASILLKPFNVRANLPHAPQPSVVGLILLELLGIIPDIIDSCRGLELRTELWVLNLLEKVGLCFLKELADLVWWAGGHRVSSP